MVKIRETQVQVPASKHYPAYVGYAADFKKKTDVCEVVSYSQSKTWRSRIPRSILKRCKYQLKGSRRWFSAVDWRVDQALKSKPKRTPSALVALERDPTGRYASLMVSPDMTVKEEVHLESPAGPKRKRCWRWLQPWPSRSKSRMGAEPRWFARRCSFWQLSPCWFCIGR